MKLDRTRLLGMLLILSIIGISVLIVVIAVPGFSETVRPGAAGIVTWFLGIFDGVNANEFYRAWIGAFPIMLIWAGILWIPLGLITYRWYKRHESKIIQQRTRDFIPQGAPVQQTPVVIRNNPPTVQQQPSAEPQKEAPVT